MTDPKELELSLAKSMHWSYSKLTEGSPGAWKALDGDTRGLWLKMARRAIRRIETLKEGSPESAAA